MIAPGDLESRIHDLVAARIGVHGMGDGTFAVDLPLMFPDGDECRIYVSPKPNDRWDVSDGGASVMRASYALSVDVTSEGYADRLSMLAAMHGLTVDHGEVLRRDTDDLADAVFSMAQASIDVVQLAKTPKARPVEKTVDFRATLARIVTRAVGARSTPTAGWFNEQIDPKKRYPVTYRIETLSKPLFVFGANSKTTCMHATMSCLFHKMNKYDFTSIAVYESEEAIAKAESERLDELVDRHFRSTDEREEIDAFIREVTAR